MSEIKTWDMRAGKRWPEASEIIEAMQDEIDELRAALADRDAKLAALEKQEPVDWIKLNKEADVIVRSKPTWKRFIDGTPLSNDISVWMADFAEIYADRGEKAEAKLAALEHWNKHYTTIECPQCGFAGGREHAAAGTAPAPMELVLTFNFGTLVKAEFQDRILYEVDLSPKSYFEVCWAHGWAGDYETEEDAENECLSLCGYSRSIREVKPGDDGYKNPRQPQLTEKRFLLAAAGAAPNAWKDAILDVMTIYGMDAPTTDAPEKIIKDLIELATRVAIDPILVAGTAPAPEDWRSAVAMAYGHLWHINNEPMAPIPLRSEESASYAARKLLRDLLTTEERGEAINSVRAMLSSAPKDAP